MIHATLQIQTIPPQRPLTRGGYYPNGRREARGRVSKILVIVKDSSGKPTFLCSLAPKKERLNGALATRAIAIPSASDAKKKTNPIHSAAPPFKGGGCAQLLGFKLGQACIFKGIQSVDVVIQEHSGPTSLLLQGLRMGGVRFNRFRVFNTAERSENLKSLILDRRTQQLAKHNKAIARLLARRANKRSQKNRSSAAAAARRANSAVSRSAGVEPRRASRINKRFTRGAIATGRGRSKKKVFFFWRSGGLKIRATPLFEAPPFTSGGRSPPRLGGNSPPLHFTPFGGWSEASSSEASSSEAGGDSHPSKASSSEAGGYRPPLHFFNKMGAPKFPSPLLGASLLPTKVEQLNSKKKIKEFLNFLRILTKSRLIKKSTKMAPKLTARAAHHQLKNAKALKFKINKILYRKRRRKAIRKNRLTFLRCVRRGAMGLVRGGGTTPFGGGYASLEKTWGPPLRSFHALFPLRVTSPFTRKKVEGGEGWKALATRSKKQNLLQLTPSYNLRRSFAAFVSTSIQLPRAKTGVQGSKRQVQRIVGGVMPQQRNHLVPLTKTKQARHVNSKRKKLSKARAQQLQTRYIANVQNTLNNTIITITNRSGNTKLWCSSGSIGLKASRRSTNYAAQSVAEAVAKKCKRLGIRRVEVKVQGVGYGKPSALKGLRIGGLKIKRIIDTTPKAHNGCRAPKKRRV